MPEQPLPETPQGLLELGDRQYLQQRYEAAVQHWTSALNHPKATDVEREKAREYLALIPPGKVKSKTGSQPVKPNPKPASSKPAADGTAKPKTPPGASQVRSRVGVAPAPAPAPGATNPRISASAIRSAAPVVLPPPAPTATVNALAAATAPKEPSVNLFEHRTNPAVALNATHTNPLLAPSIQGTTAGTAPAAPTAPTAPMTTTAVASSGPAPARPITPQNPASTGDKPSAPPSNLSALDTANAQALQIMLQSAVTAVQAAMNRSAEPPNPAVGSSPSTSPSALAKDDAALATLKSKLGDVEQQLSQQKQLATELERNLLDLKEKLENQKQETRTAQKDSEGKKKELVLLNQELAGLSRELLTKDRENAKLKLELMRRGIDANLIEGISADSGKEPSSKSSSNRNGTSHPNNTDDNNHNGHSSGSSAPSNLNPNPVEMEPVATTQAWAALRKALGDSGASAPAPRSAVAAALTFQDVQHVVPSPLANPPGGAILRTGHALHERPFNWLALAAGIGLCLSVLLPWHVASDGTLLGLGELHVILFSHASTWLQPHDWRVLADLLWLLPVFGAVVLIWEWLQWHGGANGHTIVSISGVLMGLLLVLVFAGIGPRQAVPTHAMENFISHLSLNHLGLITALLSSLGLILAGIVWPRVPPPAT